MCELAVEIAGVVVDVLAQFYRRHCSKKNRVNVQKIVSRVHGFAAFAAGYAYAMGRVALLSWFGMAVANALELTGEPVQGGLLVGQLEPGQSVQYRGKALQLDQQHRFIVALDRDAEPELVLQVSSPASGEKQSMNTQIYPFAIRNREYSIQHIEGVEQKYVEPNPKQVERSRREGQWVVNARRQQRAQNDFFDGFIWPVRGPITGVFGSQRVYNGQPRRPHYGVDVARPTGTPVVAPSGGLVTLAHPDLYFSGGTLIIDHGHGLSSTFLHLSKLLVAEDQQVLQGQAVGHIGATGRVTGAHLDWRMNWTGAGGNVRLDPQLLVEPMSEWVALPNESIESTKTGD